MLINCPECGNEVSDKAHQCPKCGFSIQGMIVCEECGTRNRKDEKSCVKCGYPFEEQKKCAFCDHGTLDANDYCNSCGMDNRDLPKIFYKKPTNNTIKSNDVYYKKPKHSLPKIGEEKSNGKRTIFWGVLLIIGMFAGCSACSADSEPQEQELTAEDFDAYDEYVETQKFVTEETKTDENIFEEELQVYNSGEYLFILPEDLYKYHTNMVGVKFYTVITVDDIKDGVIQSNISESYMMSNFKPIYDYSGKIAKDDVIAIMGEVCSDYNDYGSMGKSLEINDCYVFAKGTDTEQYVLAETDTAFSEYFIVTEEVANSNTDISEEEYKALCNVLDYNDILRNPDSYKGVYCKLNGTVSQVIEGWFNSYSIFVSDSNGNKWGCVYRYSEDESYLLEGDYVTFYGMCNGTTTSETVMGKQVILPYVDVEYIE